MRIELSSEAMELGSSVSRAIAAAGGDRLVREAEVAPCRRASLIEPVLDSLGVWELDPDQADELEAAAAACRSAGYWAVPYPVAERLGSPPGREVDGVIVVDCERPAARTADLELRWLAVDLDGGRSIGTVQPSGETPRESGFVGEIRLEPLAGQDLDSAARGLVLPIWTLLGMLDRAMELTCAHVQIREQFGAPLSRLQGVQFQLTDAEVERAGVEILAAHALWSIQSGQPGALEDALALRVAAVEAADTVFRVAHQLHGASGFCDETTLSWLSRHSLPIRRLPFGRSGTTAALAARIGRRGLDGLYSDIPDVVAP